MKTILSISLVLNILLASFFFLGDEAKSGTSAKPAGEYPFINKAVTENIGKHFIINFKPLKAELEKIQKKYPQKTYVYFSYLNNASWIGLNERDEFTAASTIKVPLAMALLKSIEQGRISVDQNYVVDEIDLNPGFGELYKDAKGKEFSVEELLRIMLEKSDNTAQNAINQIFKNIGVKDPLGEVYGFLGWEFTQSIPEFGEAPDYSKINLKTLSNLFIALYDAKYTNVEDSNKILKYLSQTPFNDKIVSGIPENITVSHKVGIASGDGTFSDCGIVYAPNRHYLLCLGSNGSSEAEAIKFMSEVSKTVYDYVINN